MLVPTWYAREQWIEFNEKKDCVNDPSGWESMVFWGRFEEGSHLYCVLEGGLRWNAEGIPHSIFEEHVRVVPKSDYSRFIPTDRLFLLRGDMHGGCNGMGPVDNSQEGIMWEEVVIDATKFFKERNAVIRLQKWWRSMKV